MTLVVFLGPTLPVEEAREQLDAIYLPPVAQGDVWRAVVSRRPKALAIIDGQFRHAPAVSHKEILFALAEGVHVFGAASMGAVRAAELHTFGMWGVGMVFEGYRDGCLAPVDNAVFEDDDEVAVLHGPAELGWQPLSEAMVDIRCSLLAAERARIITGPERSLLATVGKAIFYAERTWPLLLAHAVAAGLEPKCADTLGSWLAEGCVQQKRADALLLLQEIRAFLAQAPAPFRASFTLAPTGTWAAAMAEAGLRHFDHAGPGGIGPLSILDELRLDPPAWREVRRAALLHELAQAKTAPDRADMAAARLALRERLDLPDRQAVEAWRGVNDADAGLLDRIAEDEAALGRLERERTPRLVEPMLDRLRAEGRYARLRARAEAKLLASQKGLAEADIDSPVDLRVVSWFFERRLGIPVPDDLDAYARDLGLADAAALRQVLWREFRFGDRHDVEPTG